MQHLRQRLALDYIGNANTIDLFSYAQGVNEFQPRVTPWEITTVIIRHPEEVSWIGVKTWPNPSE